MLAGGVHTELTPDKDSNLKMNGFHLNHRPLNAQHRHALFVHTEIASNHTYAYKCFALSLQSDTFSPLHSPFFVVSGS